MVRLNIKYGLFIFSPELVNLVNCSNVIDSVSCSQK